MHDAVEAIVWLGRLADAEARRKVWVFGACS